MNLIVNLNGSTQITNIDAFVGPAQASQVPAKISEKEKFNLNGITYSNVMNQPLSFTCICIYILTHLHMNWVFILQKKY